MIETILLSFLVSKIKGYNIRPLFKSWTVYPIIFIEIVYLIGQAMIFSGNYSAIKYMALMKSLYLCSYLFLVFKYEIYGSAIIGSGCVLLGGLLNDIAIKANGGFMPVYPTLSYLTGYVRQESFSIVNDIHSLGTNNTSFKVLTDYIDLGYSILSIGDIFIRIFVFLIIYKSIRKINLQDKEKKLC